MTEWQTEDEEEMDEWEARQQYALEAESDDGFGFVPRDAMQRSGV